MQLSEEAIKEFQEIYKEEFGGDISEQRANELGLNLLTLFKVIYQPIRKDGNEKK